MRIPGRLPSLVERFRRDRSATGAAEFALVAAPFFMLVFAIVETAIISGAGIVLDRAVDNLARQVMTGEIQTSDIDAAAFRGKICNEVSFILDCSKLKIDLRTFPTASKIPSDVPMKLKSVDATGFCFDPGAQESITVLRVFYEWPWTAAFLQSLSPETDGKAVLVSLSAFMNEPYGTSVSTHSTCV